MKTVDLQTLRSANLPVVSDDRAEFSRRHSGNSFLTLDPLYVLPADLLASLAKQLPSFLSSKENQFERDLGELCGRHHCLGFFLGKPVLPLRVGVDVPIPLPSEEDLQKLGWAAIYKSPKDAIAQFQVGIDRVTLLRDRQEAFLGWLFTSPLFLAERDQLRQRWGQVIRELGEIPSYPVKAEKSSHIHRPRRTKDVTTEFVDSFNIFYERWELGGLATWDLPHPTAFNLSGNNIECFRERVSTITYQFPPNFLSRKVPLQEIIDEIETAQTPEHLQSWREIETKKQGKSPGYVRYQQLYTLIFYRDVVLASRYPERFEGHTEGLDEAFGSFIGVGADSVKKLRLLSNRRRRNP